MVSFITGVSFKYKRGSTVIAQLCTLRSAYHFNRKVHTATGAHGPGQRYIANRLLPIKRSFNSV